jgi:phenylalanyl-tRNA synthetase beta chain
VSGVQIKIEAPNLCHRYTALAIRGITIKPSPKNIAARLEAVGLRPINNVVDVTNYVMLALGHPLHAFDLDKLADSTIIVRAGQAGESIKSLDGETRKIDPETVVIADAKRAVGLGGIIGGFDTEITQSTRNVLLECAWFEPSAIRRTARRLGIKTDASYRFERRVDPNDTMDAIQLAAKLITETAGGSAEAPIDVVAIADKPDKVRLRAAKLHEASAGAIGDSYAIDILTRLGFAVEKASDGMIATVPTYRGDIHEEADLIEEVLRFFGLNNIPASLPRMTMGDVRREEINLLEDETRQILASAGMSETISYSFIRREWNALFSDEEPVAVTNALSENVASMRLRCCPACSNPWSSTGRTERATARCLKSAARSIAAAIK